MSDLPPTFLGNLKKDSSKITPEEKAKLRKSYDERKDRMLSSFTSPPSKSN